MARIQIGNPAKSVLMVGLRGVGKTVLLDKIRQDADARGMQTISVEAPEGRSLPAMLAPQLRLALLRLSRVEQAKAVAEKGLRALAGFAKALKFKFKDIEVGFDFDPEPGLADNGDLQGD
jgi:signal recognition particle GTPase